ncbi:GDSL lipase/esterase [Kalaharituber pfeilii]|nr:GDSL lipase/esterase [Kalaharituber pfeilii]
MKTGIVAFLALSTSVALHAQFSAAEPVPISGSSKCYKVKNSIKASKSGWKKIETLVAFGDSYTDESRLGYFGEHGGSPPPVGWEAPASNNTASGGKCWARFVSEMAGVKLYNYAVSGAVCSNDLTPRIWDTIKAPFPSITDYEMPAFKAEHTDAACTDLDPAKTAYSFWIGTNDLGGNAFLSDEHLPGVTMTDYTDCIFNQIETLYEAAGARYFILQNNVPLDKSPLYTAGTADQPGYGNTRFWANKEEQFLGNLTRVEEKMRLLVESANDILKYRSFATILGKKLPGATIALFDSHKLVNDIIAKPSDFLTGPAPLNVTGHNYHCPTTTWDGCYLYRGDERDSFLWYDELHPSEITSKVVAKEVTKLLDGKSSNYITVIS